MKESGITLDISSGAFFRLQDAPTYQKLQHLKEMDVLLYRPASDTLYCVELKGWTTNRLREETEGTASSEEMDLISSNRWKSNKNNIWKKAIDTLAIVNAMTIGTSLGQSLTDEVGFSVSDQTKLVFLVIVKWTDADTSRIVEVRDDFRRRFRPYAQLKGRTQYLCLTEDQAKKKFDFVV